MGSRSRMNPVDSSDDWQVLRTLLIAYDLTVGDHPSHLTQELFDEALLLVRLKCGEEI
jgi:hypothetical protein